MTPQSIFARPLPITQATLLALGLGLAAWGHGQALASDPADACKSGSESVTQAVDPESMLRLTEKRYSSARTYRDQGVVRINFGTFEDERPFSTVFERDGRFHWEFRSNARLGRRPTYQYVVWSRDQRTFDSWWDLTGEHRQQNSMGDALAGPTGVSGGSATAVMPLLCNMNWGIKVTRLRNPTVKGAEKIEGVVCTIVEGQESLRKVRLWLDSSFAVRQISKSSEIAHDSDPTGEKFVAETTITISPTFDATIGDEEFDFKPPQ
jgi:hypothetical protein